MPQCPYVIYDNQTGLYLIGYNSKLNQCLWGSIGNAVCFSTQQQCDDIITGWGEVPGQRFVGQNPPPR